MDLISLTSLSITNSNGQTKKKQPIATLPWQWKWNFKKNTYTDNFNTEKSSMRNKKRKQ